MRSRCCQKAVPHPEEPNQVHGCPPVGQPSGTVSGYGMDLRLPKISSTPVTPQPKARLMQRLTNWVLSLYRPLSFDLL
jgi:hypothetical protein